MNKANVLLSAGVVIALILSFWGVIKTPSQNVVRETIREVGAMPGNWLETEDFTVNGVKTYYFSCSFNNYSSSTPCSFKTPSASTTIDFLSARADKDTSRTQIVAGKATNSWATTTALLTISASASGFEGTASTTLTNNTLVNNILAPNVWVNTSIMGASTATGSVKMILREL